MLNIILLRNFIVTIVRHMNSRILDGQLCRKTMHQIFRRKVLS